MASTNPPCVHSLVWVEFGFGHTKGGKTWVCKAAVSPSRPFRLPGHDHGTASPARSAVLYHRLLCSNVTFLALSRTGICALPYGMGNSRAKQPWGGWRQLSCWLCLCCNADAGPPCPQPGAVCWRERAGGDGLLCMRSVRWGTRLCRGIGGDNRLTLRAYNIIAVQKIWYCMHFICW